MPGSGNTSLKEGDTLWIKASGMALGALRVEDHLAVSLPAARALLTREDLDDSALIAALRVGGRSPSLETLLHAQVEGRWVDHTHPEAVLALVNAPDGVRRAREIWGEETAVVPYARPGVALARAVQRALRPGVRRLVLRHHGLVVWGDSAEAVAAETEWALAKTAPHLRALPSGERRPDAADWAQRLRAYFHDEAVVWRDDPLSVGLAGSAPEGAEMPTTEALAHTRPWLCVADPQALSDRISQWEMRYQRYLRAHLPQAIAPRGALPRMLALRGVGLFGVGRDEGAAMFHVEHAVSALRVHALAPAPLEGLPEADLVAVEYALP